MREILFRGKITDSGEWVQGAFCPDALEYSDSRYNYLDGFIRRYNPDTRHSEMLEIIRDTVGQYTGYTDKNGTKIFEHDICLFENGDGDHTLYKVLWSENKFIVCYIDDSTIRDELDDYFSKKSVLVSNIFDYQKMY